MSHETIHRASGRGWVGAAVTGYAVSMTVDPIRLFEDLSGLDYPVSREDLIRHAQEQGADTETLAALRAMPVEGLRRPEDTDEPTGT